MFPPSARIIDLSLPYDEQISGYARYPARELAKDGWNASTLQMYSHAGTHMDAPQHFGLKGTIDDFAPEELMGRAWLCRIPQVKEKALLEVADLGATAAKICKGDSLLLQTGWSQRLGSPTYRDHLPRISLILAQWLVMKQINMLGVEPPSVADVHNLHEVRQIHEVLLGGHIKIIEGLCGLDQIQAESVWLIALPLKIRHGDGAPCRVIAVETTNIAQDQ